MDCNENNDNNEFGFENYSINITLDTPLTREMLPVYSVLEEIADVADKDCIVCPKKNMNLLNLVLHYSDKHKLFLQRDEDDSTLEEWIQAKEKVNDSNLEFMVADIEEEDEYKAQTSSSDSSSESSSESKSQPQKYKKRATERERQTNFQRKLNPTLKPLKLGLIKLMIIWRT